MIILSDNRAFIPKWVNDVRFVVCTLQMCRRHSDTLICCFTAFSKGLIVQFSIKNCCLYKVYIKSQCLNVEYIFLSILCV